MIAWLTKLLCRHAWRVAYREKVFGTNNVGLRTLWVCKKCDKTRTEESI